MAGLSPERAPDLHSQFAELSFELPVAGSQVLVCSLDGGEFFAGSAQEPALVSQSMASLLCAHDRPYRYEPRPFVGNCEVSNNCECARTPRSLTCDGDSGGQSVIGVPFGGALATSAPVLCGDPLNALSYLRGQRPSATSCFLVCRTTHRFYARCSPLDPIGVIKA